MISIAHLINPVNVPSDSDLGRAQPVTFATMKAARDHAQHCRVEQFSAQYAEDREGIPAFITPTPDLERSVLDTASFRVARKLPLMADLLQRLGNASDAEYLIYSNVDIALQPTFYTAVAGLAAKGFDAFAINRRTISDRYHDPADLPLMWPQVGKPHPGWDCFVFHRSLMDGFRTGNACIGAGWIGRVMLTNLACLSRRFQVFTDLHLTFHLGNQRQWRQEIFRDYLLHNARECAAVLLEFDRLSGPLDRDTIPGRFFIQLEKTLPERRQTK